MDYTQSNKAQSRGQAVKWHRMAMWITALVIILLLGPGPARGETVLRVAVGNWEPYIGQNLPQQGMAAVILRESFADSPYRIEFEFLPWQRALLETRGGLFDASYLWADREDRREHFYYSVPVIVTTNVFFYRKDDDFNWSDYEDLKRYNIGAVLGYSYSPDWTAAVEAREFSPIMISSDEVGFDMLRMGRLNAFPTSYLVGTQILQRKFTPKEREQILVHPRKVNVHGLHLIVSKKMTDGREIVAAFNQGYNQLAIKGRFGEIVRTFLRLDDKTGAGNILP